jgi:hypothetical protein
MCWADCGRADMTASLLDDRPPTHINRQHLARVNKPARHWPLQRAVPGLTLKPREAALGLHLTHTVAHYARIAPPDRQFTRRDISRIARPNLPPRAILSHRERSRIHRNIAAITQRYLAENSAQEFVIAVENIVVPGDGFEPPTLRFSVACSTN